MTEDDDEDEENDDQHVFTVSTLTLFTHSTQKKVGFCISVNQDTSVVQRSN